MDAPVVMTDSTQNQTNYAGFFLDKSYYLRCRESK